MQKVIDFEKEIKLIDKGLSIKTPRGAEDISAVYYKGVPLYVTLPPIQGYILNTRQAGHCDKNGHPFRSKKQALDAIKIRLKEYDSWKRKKLMEG